MTLVYISGALVLGIFAGVELDLLPWPFFMAAGPVILGAILLRKHPRVVYALMLAALLAGVGRGAVSTTAGPPDDLQALSRLETVEIAGVVEDYPEPRDGLTRFRFDIHGYSNGGAWVESGGLLLVMAKPSAPMIEGRDPPFFHYGDSLVLTGALTEPPVFDGFDWRERLAREGVHYLMLRPEVELVGGGQGSPPLQWLYRLRAEMAASLGRSLPEPHASLAQAMLLGIRSSLPSELRDDLAQTGTKHLVAISGLHVGILVGLVSLGSAAILGRRRQLYIVIPLLFVWAYALLTGFSPPVARAAIMASLYLWAVFLGRQRSGLTALSAAAAFMVVLDPDILAELSFQLSFLAMAGLLLLGPWFRAAGLRLAARHWEPEGVPGAVVKFFVEATAISLAAILATAPNYRNQLPFPVTRGVTSDPACAADYASCPGIRLCGGAGGHGVGGRGAGVVLGGVAVAYVDDGGDRALCTGPGVDRGRGAHRPLFIPVVLRFLARVVMVGTQEMAQGPPPVGPAGVPDPSECAEAQGLGAAKPRRGALANGVTARGSRIHLLRGFHG